MRTLLAPIVIAASLLLLPALVRADEQDKRAKEIENLREALKTAIDRVAALEREKAILRDKAVSEEIKSRTLAERVRKLENLVAEQTKVIARLNTGVPTAGATAPKMPVEGLVREVNGDLLTISLGADAGLAKGNTLEVYRLGTNARYLGRIRVVDVKPTTSTGEVIGKTTAPIEKGDRVASRIGGP